MDQNKGHNQDYECENRTGQNSYNRMDQNRPVRRRCRFDRRSYNHNPRDRNYQSRYSGSQRIPHVSQTLDIHDANQFPSIQEVSTGKRNRDRGSTPFIRSLENRVPTQEIVEESNGESESQRSVPHSSHARPDSYQNHPQSLATTYQYQNRTMANYRTIGSRYGGPRQERKYNTGYSRRYPWWPYDAFVPDGTHDALYNGNITDYHMINNAPNSYIDNKFQVATAIAQVEYYFSSQNLVTDSYLRSKMDSDGWVDLNIIYKFRKIQALDISFGDFVNSLLSSEDLEIDNDKKRIRTAYDPKIWLLDNLPSIYSQNAVARTFPASESNYVSPLTLVNSINTRMISGYPFQLNHEYNYFQSIGVVPAALYPIHNYQYQEFSSYPYYGDPKLFDYPYGQNVYTQYQNISVVAESESTQKDTDNSIITSQINPDDAQPIASSSTKDDPIPHAKPDNMDDITKKLSNMDI